MSLRARLQRLTAAGFAVAVVAACGTNDASNQVSASGETQYPLTVRNCDVDVTFDAAPERFLLTASAPVTYLHELGALDQAVAKAGAFPPDYYSDDVNAILSDIPLLTDRVDTSGHLIISAEVIIDAEPDLLFGLPDGIERQNMDDVGINTLIEPIYCPEDIDTPDFEDIYEQMRFLGLVFDRNDEAEAAVAELEQRVEDLRANVGENEGTTAAVLYPTPGEVTTYAYGNKSMAHPQLTTLGYENVFGDVDDRVFEVTIEELLGRDPDLLILLHSTDDPEAIETAITQIPGAESLTAVQSNAILVLLFNYTEPPTPLAIDGTEMIAEHFAAP